MAKIEFYLFRHGETDWNFIGRMQGSADIPMNAHGLRQAESLRAFFELLKADFPSTEELLRAVVSSPLMRATETVRIALQLSEVEGQLIRTDARWAETHLGQAEGMTREELTATFGEDIWHNWISLGPESWHAKFPEGETKGEVRDRALAALKDLVSESESVSGPRRWFIATHGGLLRRLLHHFHPEEKIPIDVVNCAVFKIIYEDGTWSVKKNPVFVP